MVTNVKRLVKQPATRITHVSEIAEAVKEFKPDAIVLSGTLRDFVGAPAGRSRRPCSPVRHDAITLAASGNYDPITHGAAPGHATCDSLRTPGSQGHYRRQGGTYGAPPRDDLRPVVGFVQVPCIERWAFVAVKAVERLHDREQ